MKSVTNNKRFSRRKLASAGQGLALFLLMTASPAQALPVLVSVPECAKLAVQAAICNVEATYNFGSCLSDTGWISASQWYCISTYLLPEVQVRLVNAKSEAEMSYLLAECSAGHAISGDPDQPIDISKARIRSCMDHLRACARLESELSEKCRTVPASSTEQEPQDFLEGPNF